MEVYVGSSQNKYTRAYDLSIRHFFLNLTKKKKGLQMNYFTSSLKNEAHSASFHASLCSCDSREPGSVVFASNTLFFIILSLLFQDIFMKSSALPFVSLVFANRSVCYSLFSVPFGFLANFL